MLIGYARVSPADRTLESNSMPYPPLTLRLTSGTTSPPPASRPRAEGLPKAKDMSARPKPPSRDHTADPLRLALAAAKGASLEK